MKRHFYQLDVFTDKPLEGNPLAVITDGDGLSPRKMQLGALRSALSAKLPRIDVGVWVRAHSLDAVRANEIAERLQSGSGDTTTAAAPAT